MVWSILAGADRMELENGMELRLLSALEVLEARREAGPAGGEPGGAGPVLQRMPAGPGAGERRKAGI